MPANKLKVGFLGATGTVGQRFILLIDNHPKFQLHTLGASSSSVGKPYKEAVQGRWKQTRPIPNDIASIPVKECTVENFQDCQVVFSGLDSGPASKVEPAFRSANLRIFSNAKNYRMDPLCPLVVPLANTSHLDMIPFQQQSQLPKLTKGFIVTNANCSTTGIIPPLQALQNKFGPLDKVLVTTMQAVSGGGYPGVSSFDILDNVVPFIGEEEEKIERETRKMLGKCIKKSNQEIVFETEPIIVSAHCNRVPVLDGHTECVSVSFKNQPAPSPEQVKECFRNFTCEAQKLKCHSAPEVVITVHEEPDRPQPRLDRDHQNGAGVNVGRVRKCPVLDIKVSLSKIEVKRKNIDSPSLSSLSCSQTMS